MSGRRRAWPDLELFNAARVVACSMDDLTEIVDGPAALAQWFGVRRDPHTASIVVPTTARQGVLILGGLVEEWMPRSHTLIATAIGPAAVVVHAHITIRQAMTSRGGTAHPGVEVWLHLEVPATRAGRRVLGAVRPVVERGLRRLEAEFDAR